ncbi:MAG: DUF3418 domain-containing protein, partial [Smithellaceae bacterium]|nr:DUF3418 domain-containing protein [Smithellaceae bacterium]
TDRREAEALHKEGVKNLFTRHFTDELRHMRKAIVPSAPLKSALKHTFSIKALELAVYERALYNLFGIDIRSREEFKYHMAAAKSRILPAGQMVLNEVEPVLLAHCETVRRLLLLERANRQSRPAQVFLGACRADIEKIVPPDFVANYDPTRLVHLPRYLKAQRIRAERGLVDLSKAGRRDEEIKAFVKTYRDMLINLSPSASEEKKRALEDLRWMIEELKVSIYAQELKTAFPVSSKRLHEKIQQIERMA